MKGSIKERIKWGIKFWLEIESYDSLKNVMDQENKDYEAYTPVAKEDDENENFSEPTRLI